MLTMSMRRYFRTKLSGGKGRGASGQATCILRLAMRGNRGSGLSEGSPPDNFVLRRARGARVEGRRISIQRSRDLDSRKRPAPMQRPAFGRMDARPVVRLHRGAGVPGAPVRDRLLWRPARRAGTGRRARGGDLRALARDLLHLL